MNLPAFLVLVFLICIDFGQSENVPREDFPEVKTAGTFGGLFDTDDTLGYKTFLDKIVGGSVAKYGDVPWQVSMKYSGVHKCGAAILNEYWLLSAAHCYVKTTAQGWKVTVGEHYLYRQDALQQDFQVEKIFNHNLYIGGGRYAYDFALIKIRPAVGGRGIKFNNVANPISLPSSTMDLPDGAQLLISGWGTTQEVGDISEVLKKAWVPYVSQQTCRRLLGSNRITDQMFCAGQMEGGTDTCKHDSGGPVAYKSKNKYVLFGIVSWGDGCAHPYKPGVYARVTTVLPWIESTIKLNS